jgi:hypothetical protein
MDNEILVELQEAVQEILEMSEAYSKTPRSEVEGYFQWLTDHGALKAYLDLCRIVQQYYEVEDRFYMTFLRSKGLRENVEEHALKKGTKTAPEH